MRARYIRCFKFLKPPSGQMRAKSKSFSIFLGTIQYLFVFIIFVNMVVPSLLTECGLGTSVDPNFNLQIQSMRNETVDTLNEKIRKNVIEPHQVLAAVA